MELIAPPKRTVLRQEMKICNTSFLLKSTLLFSNKSDCGNHVRTFTHEKLGRIFGHTGSPRSLLSELSANLPIREINQCCKSIDELVIGLKVRRNQPQSSKIRPKLRTRQNLRGSYRSRSGICQRTNGNLECIFCLKNDMYYTNEPARGNCVEHSAQFF